MVAPADSWIPGYRFKNGKLLIFQQERITLVKVWPEPEAAQKVGDDPWRPIHPEFRLVRPYRPRKRRAASTRQLMLPLELPPAAPTKSELADQKRRAFGSLRFSLPREVARAIERFQCGQFAMIRMFGATETFLDLAVSNPSLAFYVADRFGRRSYMDDAGLLACRKQRELAELLRFPGTPAATRVLRKVVPESVTPESADQLRDALLDEDARGKLSHLRKINAGVMKLLGDRRLRAAVAPALLEEVAQDAREKYCARTADILQDVLDFDRELRGSARPATFQCTSRLQDVHHELSQEYAAKKGSGILDCMFPRPPVRGTADIVPLTEPRELIAEGLRQRNCVASYAHAVERGDTYIYRVLRPERATLAIRQFSSGRWYCAELKAACNVAVRAATGRAISTWLDERTVSA